MTRSRQRLLLVAAITFFVLSVVGVGGLFFYFRPTVEYAYVDSVDIREKSIPPGGFLMPLAVVVLGLTFLVVAWWFIKHRRRS